MSRRLVICCDGTWNKPDQLMGGVRTPSHVAKIALGLASEDGEGNAQLLHYAKGVGTRRLERLSGGISGYGLSRSVRECYRFVIENYEPGDKLYLFGFSRGAYTARSTVGLIRNCGILHPRHIGRLDEAYSLYRMRGDRAHPTSMEAQLFRRMYSHDEIDIHFVGVWDTVGSLGIPIDGLRIGLLEKLWGFHDTELSSHVRSAFQALAIDEERGPYKPTLWTQQAHAQGQILEQVWFAGGHCDVGGGCKDPSLSEIPLLWMVQRARDRGLAFKPDHFVPSAKAATAESRWMGQQLVPDRGGAIQDIRGGIYLLTPVHRRTLVDRDQQSAASSAVKRLREMADYRPASLEQWTAAQRRVTDVQDGP